MRPKRDYGYKEFKERVINRIASDKSDSMRSPNQLSDHNRRRRDLKDEIKKRARERKIKILKMHYIDEDYKFHSDNKYGSMQSKALKQLKEKIDDLTKSKQ